MDQIPSAEEPEVPGWPPPRVPPGSLCEHCGYDLHGVALSDQAMASCPECGRETQVKRRGAEAKTLQQYDVRCIGEKDEAYFVPMIAGSLSEACHLVAAENHRVDAHRISMEVTATPDLGGLLFSLIAGFTAVCGLCAWQAGLVAIGLACGALLMSKGKRGRVPLAIAVVLCALGLMFRNIFR